MTSTEWQPRLNCWEFKQCGREPDGIHADEMGVCPAAVWNKHPNMNGGAYGGRICWALVGTLCGGKVQGTFAGKIDQCSKCDFYQHVVAKEGKSLVHGLPDPNKAVINRMPATCRGFFNLCVPGFRGFLRPSIFQSWKRGRLKEARST